MPGDNMENETTLNAAEANVSGDTGNTEAGNTMPGRSNLVPFPSDKLRELHLAKKERDELLASRSTLQTASKAPLGAAEQAAVDIISEATAARLAPLMQKVDKLNQRSETEDLDRELSRFENDPRNNAIKDEYYTELRSLIKSNPDRSMRELSEEAQKNALYNAFNSGKLNQSIEDDADDRLRTKTRLSSPSHSAVSTGRGKTEKSLQEMTPEELVASGRFNEYFQSSQGRAPRR